MNLLAEMTAKWLHDVRWYDEASSDIVVIQCADNYVATPASTESPVVVLHDWRDKYLPYVETASKVVCLGNFQTPEFESTRLESFPIEPDVDFASRNSFDLVVGGRPGENDAEYIKSHLTGEERSILLCCNFDLDSPQDSMLGEVFSDYPKDTRIVIRQDYSDVMVALAYRTAKRIIHCGSGTRGWLHSLAVKHCDNIVTKTGDNSYTPSDVKEWIKIIALSE